MFVPPDSPRLFYPQTVDEAGKKEKVFVNYFAEVALRLKGDTWLAKSTKPAAAEMELSRSLSQRQARNIDVHMDR